LKYRNCASRSKNTIINQGENKMVNEDQEREIHNNQILGVLIGALMGGLVGAAAMLLLAPQSGKRTRAQIQHKSIELRDRTAGMMEDTLEQVRMDSKKIARSGRHKAKELMHQGQTLVAEQMDHVSEFAEAGKKALQGS
jgi:gas vesicle protein